jgi:cardiolipin synthase
VNLPNSLTIARIFLAPILVSVLLTKFEGRLVLGLPVELVGAAIFGLASLTDWLDGYLARRWGETSAFGAFLDPVADKLMVAAALILLVEQERAPAYLAMIIIGREIAISALREWMAQLGAGRKTAVAFIGKIKTVAQMTAIIALLLWEPVIPGVSTPMVGIVALWVAAILTLWSMFHYLRLAAPHFADSPVATTRRSASPSAKAGKAAVDPLPPKTLE